MTLAIKDLSLFCQYYLKFLRKLCREPSNFLESKRKKLLSNAQHGFRPGLSTITALTKVTNDVYESMDNKTTSLEINPM